MNLLVLQLCIVKEISIVAQLEFLQQITDDQFMTTRYADIIGKDQCFTRKEILIKMISVIDDKCLPAFHIQRAIINAIRLIAMNFGGFCRMISVHAQITVQHFYKCCGHIVRSSRDSSVWTG